jgi:hypothetical protein
MALLTLYNLLDINAAAPPGYSNANVAGTDLAPNTNGRTRIWVINGGASQDCTIVSQQESNFGPYDDFVFEVIGNGFTVLPPLHPTRFNNANGQIEFSFTTPAQIQVLAVEDELVLKGIAP